MKNEIIQFLRENIIGKTLLTGAVYKLENGNLEGVYNDKMTFSNLVTTENGFKFNMTTVTQELVYNLDDKGTRTTIAKDYKEQVCFVMNWQCGKAQSKSQVICAVFQPQFKIPQWKP